MHHLAQVNIARMIAPLTDPLMVGFVAQLAPVNALADSSPGFIWRLQTDAGDATSLSLLLKSSSISIRHRGWLEQTLHHTLLSQRIDNPIQLLSCLDALTR